MATETTSRLSAAPADTVVPIEDTSLTAFYKDMNLAERRTFWSCATGWALDGMDFMIYPLVIGTIIKLWNVDPGSAGAAVTATLLASAIGGWLAGYLADRIGRVLTLQITILWFSFFSIVCAFAQDFNQLLIARTILGLGFGGEWAAGAVLMGEVIRPQYRGRAVGSVQSGWAVGWGLAVLSQAILFSLLPAEQAWRWMFVIGALPALLVFYLRRYVKEPEISAETRRHQAASGDRPAIWEIFAGPILKTTILASLVATGMQGGYYAITAWVPRFLTTERHLSIVSSTGLSRDADHRLVHWLSRRRLARRPDRAAQSVPDLLTWRDRRRPRLYADTAVKQHSLAPWLPARLLRLRLFLRHGRLPHGALPDAASRLRPGLLLQFWPRHRRAVPDAGRRHLGLHDARQRDRYFRGRRLRGVLHRRLCAAGDARPSAARRCVKSGRSAEARH